MTDREERCGLTVAVWGGALMGSVAVVAFLWLLMFFRMDDRLIQERSAAERCAKGVVDEAQGECAARRRAAGGGWECFSRRGVGEWFEEYEGRGNFTAHVEERCAAFAERRRAVLEEFGAECRTLARIVAALCTVAAGAATWRIWTA